MTSVTHIPSAAGMAAIVDDHLCNTLTATKPAWRENPYSEAWWGLYQASEGHFFEITADHYGEEHTWNLLTEGAARAKIEKHSGQTEPRPKRKTQPVNLGPFSFLSKTAAGQAVKALLHCNHGKDLIGDDLLLAEAVLQAHPDAAKKLRNGYWGMRVDRDPVYKTWCLWLRDEEGGVEDVSYRVALGLVPSEPTLQTAARHVLKEQMADFRRRAFANGPVQCPVSSQLLREDEAHVDHAPPWTFDKIVRAYESEHGTPALRHDGTRDGFCDPADAKRFQDFHDERAQLRVVHRSVNLSDLRRRPS
jgi:hypothetical protein